MKFTFHYSLRRNSVLRPKCRFLVFDRGLARVPRARHVDRGMLPPNTLPCTASKSGVTIAAVGATSDLGTAQSIAPKYGTTASFRREALQRRQLVLVAEDNIMNQKLILHQLAVMGFVGDVTDNGRHALRLWQSGDYALLLTDLHMPEMDGYELVARIRAEENGRCRVPIVALSANVLEREIDRCRNAGMDDYLSKPVRMADLKGLLKKWLPETCCDAVEHVATLYTVVDLNVLADSVGNDPEVIQDFLGEFKITAVNIAATMNAAWVQGSTAQVAAQAHKLKSSARAIGALALSELCDQVERAGRLDDRCALATLLPAFVQEFSRVGDFLDMT